MGKKNGNEWREEFLRRVTSTFFYFRSETVNVRASDLSTKSDSGENASANDCPSSPFDRGRKVHSSLAVALPRHTMLDGMVHLRANEKIDGAVNC